MKETIALTRSYTRQHSLFYCYVWNNSDKKGFKRWLGKEIGNTLFLGEGKTGKLNVYYDHNELNKFFRLAVRLINSDTKFFKGVRSDFYKHWKRLLPYMKREHKVRNLTELKRFYETFIKWWTPMAIIVTAPDIQGIPEKVKKECLKIRNETQHYAEEGDLIYINFFLKNYPEYKEVVKVIAPEEIFKLKRKKLAKKEISDIKKRFNGYFIFKNKLYLANKLNEILSKNNAQIEKIENKELTELKGVPASRGYAKGKVRLVLYKEQIPELNKGEILVTEMTSPDFVPAMKKAGAIITDEGGVTCHAAIVSRELNKPCVIGTKIATHVLKDGMLVEVNANQGIIKILK